MALVLADPGLLRKSRLLVIIPAVVVTSEISVFNQYRIGPGLKPILSATKVGFILSIAAIYFGFEAGQAGKSEAEGELRPADSSRRQFSIETDKAVCFRLRPILVISMMPCAIGMSWCRLISAEYREMERNRG